MRFILWYCDSRHKDNHVKNIIMEFHQEEEESTNVLTISTVQIAPFRTLITALKDILLEANILFDSTGIKIINMDKSHTMLVHLFLEADKFEFYECLRPRIIVGVNMLHFFKFISQIENDDTLTIYIDEKDFNEGSVRFLGLKFENGGIKQCKNHKMRLIEADGEDLNEIPKVKYSSIINMPSTDFQKIIRDLSVISDKLEISSVNDELTFKCSGNMGTSEVKRAESNGSMKCITRREPQNVVQGEFSLKNLIYFIKCTNLCPQIELYLEHNKPLIVNYKVASLGEIKLYLAPLPS